jgi:hypothetical protein
LSEGNYYAAAGFLPFVSAGVAKGARLVVKRGDKLVDITEFARRGFSHDEVQRLLRQADDIVGVAGRGSRIDSYNVLKKLTAGKGRVIQAHHILEARHMKRWGYTAQQIAEAPAQILTNVEHLRLNRALEEALPTGTEYAPKQVWKAYQKVYEDYPEYLDAISDYFGK